MIAFARPTGNFPIGDDWMYARAVLSVLEHGRYEVASFSAPNVGPQVYWGALFCLPFGFSFDALRASTLVFGLVGGLALQALFIEVWNDRRLAFCGACALVTNPLYFWLACTFMTDVPSLALMLVATFLIVRGMRLDRDAIVGLGILVALIALMVRQLAAVVLVGYLFSRVTRDGFGVRSLWRSSWPLLLGLAMHIAFGRWQEATGRKPGISGIPDITPWSVLDLSTKSLVSLFEVLQYTALFAAPLIVLALARARWPLRRATTRRQLAWSGALLTVFAVLVFVLHLPMPASTGGNMLLYFGMGPFAPGDMAHGLHMPVVNGGVTFGWRIATGVALIASAIWCAGVALNGGRKICSIVRRNGVARLSRAVFFVVTAVAYLSLILIIGTKHAVFDRYLLLPIVFGGMAAPLATMPGARRRIPAWGVAVALVPIAASLAFSVVATRDYFRWGKLHWEVLQELTGPLGIAPSRIDGGMEFNGWTQYDAHYHEREGKDWWWVQDDEYIVGGGRVAGYEEIMRRPVRRVLTQEDEAVVVLRRQR